MAERPVRVSDTAMSMFKWDVVDPAPGEPVAPQQRLPWGKTIGVGAQHVVAMFGATFLVPVLTGFPVSTTLLFSGVGTLLFLLVTKNRLPSYLGSSFAFIAPITAATTTAVVVAIRRDARCRR